MITQIIWFFAWPALILVSWFVVYAVVKRFEKQNIN
jgi:hypothetical protein